MNREQLEGLAELDKPATPQQIEEAGKSLGLSFPNDYAQLLLASNGLFAHDHVKLYSTDDIVERNNTYQVARLLSEQWLMIGDDSGGYGLFLHLEHAPCPVYFMELGTMMPSEGIVLSQTLDDWAADGFPVRYN